MISDAKITQVQVKDPKGWHTIYDGATGRKTEYNVPTGSTWEVRVTAYVKSDAPDWMLAATLTANGVPDQYLKQIRAESRGASGGLTYVFPDFEMGAKLETRVLLRVTLWTSEWKTSTRPSKDKW